MQLSVCGCHECRYRSDARLRYWLSSFSKAHCLHDITVAKIPYNDFVAGVVTPSRLEAAGISHTDSTYILGALFGIKAYIDNAMEPPPSPCKKCRMPAYWWQCSVCADWLCDNCIVTCESCDTYNCSDHKCSRCPEYMSPEEVDDCFQSLPNSTDSDA